MLTKRFNKLKFAATTSVSCCTKCTKVSRYLFNVSMLASVFCEINFLNFNKICSCSNKVLKNGVRNVRNVHYVQGQYFGPHREYFYYIDHQGMLFLDDARMKNFTSCFKEIKFLKFFFTMLRMNTSDRYKDEFKYLSLCGKERNYVRCDDQPIVFTHVFEKDDKEMFSYGHAKDLLYEPFQPEKLCVSPNSGN